MAMQVYVKKKSKGSAFLVVFGGHLRILALSFIKLVIFIEKKI